MKIQIEEKSGFCYGVDRVVEIADAILDRGESLYCLGQLVHNEEEVQRLEKKGLITISHKELEILHHCRILVRAHGEPPSTYKTAKKNNLEIIDGTCPIVRKIQSGIASKNNDRETLILIFGKKDHPEVLGLVGQAPEKSLIIRNSEQIVELPPVQVIHLYSQTTMDTGEFGEIKLLLEKKQNEEGGKLVVHNTICGHVSHRRPGLQQFAANNDLVIFVGGKNSSNGKLLYQVCKEINPKSYYIGSAAELQDSWFEGVDKVGIAGATSTPRWQIGEVAEKIKELFDS